MGSDDKRGPFVHGRAADGSIVMNFERPTNTSDGVTREKANETYKIVRFRRYGVNQVIRTGLTLAEAQEHCRREDTHGYGWFDGYDLENPTAAQIAEREEQDANIRSAIASLGELGL